MISEEEIVSVYPIKTDWPNLGQWERYNKTMRCFRSLIAELSLCVF
jgi:hypothetical protein